MIGMIAAIVIVVSIVAFAAYKFSSHHKKTSKMRFILGVGGYRLLNGSMDFRETLGVDRVYPELMQRRLFDFRSKTWNRKL